MGQSIPEVFETTVQKTMVWLKEVQLEAGLKDEKQALVALRAVLQTLRDRLPAMEAIHLGAQLPMLVRGFYYEGWKPNLQGYPGFGVEEFLERIDKRINLHPEVDPYMLACAVFKVLADHVTAGELEDVVSVVPGEIRAMWPEDLQQASLQTRSGRIESGQMDGFAVESDAGSDSGVEGDRNRVRDANQPPPGASTTSLI